MSVRDVDPSVLGARIKAARSKVGLTQTQLAGDDISVAYVSRIESGQRRPDEELLMTIAARLGTTVEVLVMGASADTIADLRLALDYAELALETGSAAEALSKATDACIEAGALSVPGLLHRARFLRARALENTGDLDGAIIELERLCSDDSDPLLWANVANHLCRCYRDSGDLSRAIEIGESALVRLRELGLENSEDGIRITVNVAGAYSYRGDLGHATRLCRSAIEVVEETGTPAARALAYYNASVMESMRSGSTPGALSMAARALELLGQTEDARNRARVRSMLGIMQLEADGDELEAARYNLTTALDEMAWTSAGPFDVAVTRLALARVLLLDGAFDEAKQLLGALGAMRDEVPLLAAEALAIEGQVALENGDIAQAKYDFGRAVAELTAAGADRDAAKLWYEIGDLYDQLDERDLARQAYRSAAAASGLTLTRKAVTRTGSSARVREETALD